jgi:hypothetical protein
MPTRPRTAPERPPNIFSTVYLGIEYSILDVHFVNPSPVFCLDKTRR